MIHDWFALPSKFVAVQSSTHGSHAKISSNRTKFCKSASWASAITTYLGNYEMDIPAPTFAR